MGEQRCGRKLSAAWRKIRPYILVVLLQFGTAGTYVVSTLTLKHGMNRYVLIAYRHLVAALVISPFALLLERSNHMYNTEYTYMSHGPRLYLSLHKLFLLQYYNVSNFIFYY